MPITNTLENARRLEDTGFSHQQAQALAEVIEAALGDFQSDLATKEFVHSEIQLLRSEFKSEISELRSELKSEMSELRSEFKFEISELRSELKSDMKELELRVTNQLRGQMLWFFAMQITIMGVAITLIKLLP